MSYATFGTSYPKNLFCVCLTFQFNCRVGWGGGLQFYLLNPTTLLQNNSVRLALLFLF